MWLNEPQTSTWVGPIYVGLGIDLPPGMANS
jgi:hypothetical protein